MCEAGAAEAGWRTQGPATSRTVSSAMSPRPVSPTLAWGEIFRFPGQKYLMLTCLYGDAGLGAGAGGEGDLSPVPEVPRRGGRPRQQPHGLRVQQHGQRAQAGPEHVHVELRRVVIMTQRGFSINMKT